LVSTLKKIKKVVMNNNKIAESKWIRTAERKIESFSLEIGLK
jgi:hypothetical protein